MCYPAATPPPTLPLPQVVCGLSATAVLAPDGRLMVAGDNTDNRLGLDTETRWLALVSLH